MMKLFHDDEEDKIDVRVNQDFAKRFEHNKRREELQRLQAKGLDEEERLSKKSKRAGSEGKEAKKEKVLEQSGEDLGEERKEEKHKKRRKSLPEEAQKPVLSASRLSSYGLS
eukprot:c12840_g1_i3.p2 GENE.c12840_g1_i3~~c12840_g1_i3.p2  ORF type:complete len:119 (+),score=35.42 c12840_g1_i3:22-357(+)